MSRYRRVMCAACVVLLVSCASPGLQLAPAPTTSPARSATPARAVTAPATPTLSSAARDYLLAALDLMQARSLLRRQVDWPKLRSQAPAVAQLRHVRTPRDTYPIISWALGELGDHHSFFVPPEQAKEGAIPDPGFLPEGRQIAGRFGYLRVPAVITIATGHRYTTTAAALISSVDRAGACGWVVDLRGNHGGSIWAMLVAVGPLLGAGDIGAFVDADGKRMVWAYHDGQALLDGIAQFHLDGPGPTLRHPQPPVAVLTDGATASAAEGTVIAFRGRPKTRTFGAPTAGVPTGNKAEPLPDGALLVLTEVREADRTGHLYDGPIAPDAPIDLSRASATDPDPVLSAATRWLRQQAECMH